MMYAGKTIAKKGTVHSIEIITSMVPNNTEFSPKLWIRSNLKLLEINIQWIFKTYLDNEKTHSENYKANNKYISLN